jgi:twitching motility two-component system response regulator PilG
MAQLVMVIDDSLVIRKIVETCLHRAGYEVKSFADGVEALCWLNTTEARIPDLVVVDLGLPRLDGYQVIQQIKARPVLERTRLVILSRRDGILDRLKGRLVGAHAYLTKPFKTDQLVAVIQTSLGDAVPSTEGARKDEADERSWSDLMQQEVRTDWSMGSEHVLRLRQRSCVRRRRYCKRTRRTPFLAPATGRNRIARITSRIRVWSP